MEFAVDDLLVAYRIDTSVNMYDVRVFETAEYMEDGVGLADVCKELVAESFSLAGTLHESCDIHDFHCCRNDSLRVAEAFQNFQTLVRNVCRTDVRLYCTERKVCALSLARTYTVEQC